MNRFIPLGFALALLSFAMSAKAGSIGNYTGCKSLKGERAACEKCVGGGNFYQPGTGCGSTEGMHKSVATKKIPPPPKPSAMPKTGTEYVTITPKPFAIGSKDTDANSDSMKDNFKGVMVTLTHPFMMKTTEVTQGEWYFVTGNLTPSYDRECGLDCPVAQVSWKLITQYLNQLSKKEGLEQCYTFKNELIQWPKGYECTGYRLPTDAEWEYAARGSKDEAVYGDLDAIAWYQGNADNKPHQVGKKQKNDFGLFDMLGGVAEFCFDGEDNNPYTADVTDPIIGGKDLPESGSGTNRMLRGGGWRDAKAYVRATYRNQLFVGGDDVAAGFRPVRTVKAK